MNKNKTAMYYHNYIENSTYPHKGFKISSKLKYYNGYSYYPCFTFKFSYEINNNEIWHTKLFLKRLIDEENWFSYYADFYYLVDPELTSERLEELRKLQEERKRQEEEAMWRQLQQEEEAMWSQLQIEEERRRQAEEYRRRREEERRRREEEERRRREEERRRRKEEEMKLVQVKLHDEVEKEDVANICALYNDIKDGKIKNIPNSMKKILLSYIANVSENVQFQLQKEIKEIYEQLNYVIDDLELYIHNIT